MVEYGVLASKSSEILSGFFGQLQNLWDAIPFGTPIAIVGSVALAAYFALMRHRAPA
jgi:hypothetical protein